MDMENITSKCKKLIVTAIDFGTTYSGYAFSFRDDWSKIWGSIRFNKTPTVLLLNNKAEFVAFGFDAEDKYVHYTEIGTDKEYYLFQRFKIILHQDKVNGVFIIKFRQYIHS